MKPREFDALVRQKFDQNDFEYNPQNWVRLKEQLEGKTKKRSIIMWWWMPLVGVAASVAAFAIGVNFMWRQAATGNAGVAGFTLEIQKDHNAPLQDPNAPVLHYTAKTINHNYKPKTHKHKLNNDQVKEEKFGINLQNALNFTPVKTEKKFSLQDKPVAKKEDKKKELVAAAGSRTFKPELEKKSVGLTIFLSGGVNQGSQNSGYVGGATIRKMINDNTFIEGDVAFVSSNATQNLNYHSDGFYRNITPSSNTSGQGAKISKVAKVTNGPDPDPNVIQEYVAPTNTKKSDAYTMSYIQITPSLGVKIIKRLSIAGGPDIQQALADTRPAANANLTRDQLSVMPLFDFGFMAKTELSVNKRIKAQVSYRKGVNNMLTPGDKYIDRNYMQVQVRCAIFNK